VSTNNGTSFGAAVNVSNSPGNKFNPIVAGDGTNVHVFWTEDLSGDNPVGANTHLGSIFYGRSTNNGASFSNRTLIDQAGYSRPTSVELDSTNRPHLVFYDNRVFSNASVAGRARELRPHHVHVRPLRVDVRIEGDRRVRRSVGDQLLLGRELRGGREGRDQNGKDEARDGRDLVDGFHVRGLRSYGHVAARPL
jgi:hypothetical protein